MTGEFPAQRARNAEKGFHLMTSSRCMANIYILLHFALFWFGYVKMLLFIHYYLSISSASLRKLSTVGESAIRVR